MAFRQVSDGGAGDRDLFSSQRLNWVTAYCDGGSRGNPGPAGFGVRLEDSSGRLLGELSEYLGIQTNNFAEYSALLAALRFSIEHGHRGLRVVADSELMVKQMRGQYRVNSPELRPLYEQARRLTGQLDGFRIDHVLRGKNREADRLANLAMDQGMKDRGRRSRSAEDRGMSERGAGNRGVGERDGGKSPAFEGKAREPEAAPKAQEAGGGAKMLRGFTRGGVVHLLGSELPDGIFVKVIPE